MQVSATYGSQHPKRFRRFKTAVSCPESLATTEHQLFPLSCERISPQNLAAQFCDYLSR